MADFLRAAVVRVAEVRLARKASHLGIGPLSLKPSDMSDTRDRSLCPLASSISKSWSFCC